jgi:hypothetical protein
MAVYTNSGIDAIREEISAEDLEDIKLFREYSEGRHNSMMTPAQRRLLYPQKLNKQADNVLRLVLSTIASRLVFTGWEVKEPKPEVGDTATELEEDREAVGPVQGALDDVFMRNRLQKLQYETHWAMCRDGNTAISLSWRGGRPRIHRERWWDGEDGIFVGYDRTGEEEFAVREWTEIDPEGNKHLRRTVYYPDHFIRYVKEGQGWAPIRTTPTAADLPTSEDGALLIPGQDDPLADGSIRWEKKPGDPLGLPVIHFPNGSRDDSPYGSSDLVGLLGLQDEINSMQHDVSATSKFTGFQMTWVKGAAGPSVKVGPGRLLEFPPEITGNPAGVLPAGDMSSLLSGLDHKRATVAINSGTPIQQIIGKDWPSGEAILQTQMAVIDKAMRLIQIVGPLHTQYGHRNIEMLNTFGNAGLDEDAPITAVMDNPRRIDELTEVRIQKERAQTLEIIGRIADPVLLRMIPELSERQVREILANREGLTLEEMDTLEKQVADQEEEVQLEALDQEMVTAEF